jgi:hypothetical protein
MESPPVVTMLFSSPAPGVDPVLFDRFMKWQLEVYAPLTMQQPHILSWAHYKIVKETPQYPSYGYIMHYTSKEEADKNDAMPALKAVMADTASWLKQGIFERFWRARYELLKSGGNRPEAGLSAKAVNKSAALAHLEACVLSPEEEAKYGEWLEQYGFNIFLPLQLDVPGLIGYEIFKYTTSNLDYYMSGKAKETSYPPYLSIIYFDSAGAFENYTSSAELVMYQKALRNVFPLGPLYKWYVQYQLVKSLVK